MKHFALDIIPTLIEAAKSNLSLSEVDFGGFLSESACQKLEDYFCLLSEWTSRVDLVAVAEPWALFLDHGLDGLLSLAALELKLPSGTPRRVLDVGSGSGLPGYLWAIARPDWKLTLCEPREKRVVFLKEVRRRLQLKAVQVYQSRLENVSRETLVAQDLLSFRALAPTEELLAAARTLLSETGYVVWLGGAEAIVEPSLLKEVPLRAEYRIPGDTRGRQLVFLRP